MLTAILKTGNKSKVLELENGSLDNHPRNLNFDTSQSRWVYAVKSSVASIKTERDQASGVGWLRRASILWMEMCGRGFNWGGCGSKEGGCEHIAWYRTIWQKLSYFFFLTSSSYASIDRPFPGGFETLAIQYTRRSTSNHARQTLKLESESASSIFSPFLRLLSLELSHQVVSLPSSQAASTRKLLTPSASSCFRACPTSSPSTFEQSASASGNNANIEDGTEDGKFIEEVMHFCSRSTEPILYRRFIGNCE